MDFVNTEQARKLRSDINIKGVISEKGEPRTVNTKYGETTVCDCQLKDDVGSIKLSLWGDEIQNYQNGDKVEIHNAFTSVYKNTVQLQVPKKNGEILKSTS